jgi:hypothetical protein
MTRRKSTDELAQELEQQSEDPGIWEQEAEEIESRPRRTSVLSLRLPTKEFHALLRSARSAGESLSEYVRGAILLRQRMESEPYNAALSVGYPSNRSNDETDEWRSYTSGAQSTDLVVTTSR